MRVWVVRAGRRGERVTTALRENAVIAGWEEVDEDLSAITDRARLRALLDERYPTSSPQVLANWTGQLWRFIEEIAEDDLVVMPVPGDGRRELAVGTVTGPYHFVADAPPGFQHTRPVTWWRTDVDRDAVRSDLRDSMGSLLTVFELRRHHAAHRVRVLAESGIDPGPGDSLDEQASVSSPQRLAERVAAAEDGEPVVMTVRDLLAVWGHHRRWQSVVDQISADLQENGLSTTPPFTDGSINSRITVVPVGAEPGAETRVPTRTELPDEASPDDRPVALLVNKLPSANTTPAAIHVGEQLHTATTRMAIDNYSQLPVLDDDGRLHGVVSWETVGLAHLSGQPVTLTRATGTAREVDGDDDLLEHIGEIYRRGFVFVRDRDRKICGIVTSADLTEQLGNQLGPFVLLAEIEQRLRRILRRALETETITLDQIQAKLGWKNKNLQSPDELTMGNYPYVFAHDGVWSGLDWSIDRDRFCDRLQKAATFRNDVMHLNSQVDPESEEKLQPLRGLLSTLRALDQ